jgi:tetratricopeptide (TPR) repeat protein
MSLPWQDLLSIPTAFIETGITMMDAGTVMLRNGLGAITGQHPDTTEAPPVNGPRDAAAALADVANQMVRVGYLTPLSGPDILTGFKDIWRTTRRSFSYLDPRDPRILAAPLDIPLSAAGIVADSLMRAMAVYRVAGIKRFPGLIREAMELYSDTAIFVTLGYKDMIVRFEDRLQRNPNDYGTRLLLGRTYTKCGLFDHAARELERAAEGPATRTRALHELLVAHHRAGRFQKALEYGVQAMDANPENVRTRNIMWLASKGLGSYPETVPEAYRMECKAGYETPTCTYENIAPKIGLLKTNSGRGSVVFDYNNDGYLDVLITGPHSGVSLYRNNGDGTFTDVSVESGIDTCINGFGVVAGDYDNDGNMDLFITKLGFYHGQAALYHNNGDGTFTDVTEQAGVKTWGPSFTSHWVDYDLDGYLDLFITYNFAEIFDRHSQNRLFHNNGDGTFTDVTNQSGLHTNFTTIGSCWGDYNNDGYPDLFLSSFMGRPSLFRNNGDGTFTDVSEAAGLKDLLFGFVCAFVDYDNDGWLDIVQFLWSDHDDFVHTLRNGAGPDDGYPMRIYHNNRDGTFTVKDREIGLDGCWGTMSGNMGDINNDGFLDIALGNGSPRMERMEPPTLMEFDGTRYRNVTFAAGLPFTGKGHAVNFADLFGNGKISVIIADGGAYPGELLSTSVYYPNQLPGNYLNVRLRGVTCNRDAIGARVTLFAGGRQIMREVFAGTAFGALPYEQHFGLKNLTEVDALEIRWPGGGVQRIEHPPVNDTILITQGQEAWTKIYSKVVEPKL